MLIAPIPAMVRRMVFVFTRVPIGWIVGLCSGQHTAACGRPLNQLIELTTIKPNAPALGAVINFNALAFGHQETGVRANGAFHRVPSFQVEPSTRRGRTSMFGYWEC